MSDYDDGVEEVAPPPQSSAAAVPLLEGGDVQISAASGASELVNDQREIILTHSVACAAQACCPSTCRTSGRSARSTPSMRPRGRSRRQSRATRRPARTATASSATRACPSAATGGAASRGCRRTATRTPAAPSGARSAPTPSGSERGRRGRRGTRSGWADRILNASCCRVQSVARWDTVVDVAFGPTAGIAICM